MNTKQDEFFQSLGDNEMTPEQAAQLLDMSGEGDTGTPEPETGSNAPDSSTDTGTGEAATTEQTATDGDKQEPVEGDNPTLLAKDGKHTIPYEKLSEARESEQHWKAQADAAQQKLDDLEAKAQERATAGEAPTDADQNAEMAQAAMDEGVDPGIFGDFTEADLAKGVNTLIDSKVDAKLDAKLKQFSEQQSEKQTEQTASEKHFGSIYEAHPDADSIGESKELSDWISSQPSHVQVGVNSVLDGGSAEQVIELFDTFKKATGNAQQHSESSGDVKAAAQAAINNAEAPVPNSLSDIPGGRPSAASPDEQMADMEGKDLLDRMQEMEPEKIDSLLNKLI